MSFTSPLGIGLGSDAEYIDVTLEEADTPSVMTDRLNVVMNDEIRVKLFSFIKDTAKPSMSVLAACDYLIAVNRKVPASLQTGNLQRKTLILLLCRIK